MRKTRPRFEQFSNPSPSDKAPGTRLERLKNILSNKLERKKGMEEEEDDESRLSFSGVEG